jgi:hypothetical protein
MREALVVPRYSPCEQVKLLHAYTGLLSKCAGGRHKSVRRARTPTGRAFDRRSGVSEGVGVVGDVCLEVHLVSSGIPF